MEMSRSVHIVAPWSFGRENDDDDGGGLLKSLVQETANTFLHVHRARGRRSGTGIKFTSCISALSDHRI
jgi:hypothetical protein